MFLNEVKDIAWQSAQIVEEYNPARIYPVSRLKLQNVPEELWDNPLNIRAFHWQNNQSKGNSYPMYTAVVSDEGATNMKCEAVYLVNEALQYSLRKLFKITE